MPGLRSDCQADTELTCPPTDRKCQHGGDADHGDRQGDGGEAAEHQRVQPVWREHLGADVFERRRALDRLVHGHVPDNASDRGHQSVRIRAYVNEQTASPNLLLLEGVVYGQGRAWHHVFVVHVGCDAYDAPGCCADVDELHHRIGPHNL